MESITKSIVLNANQVADIAKYLGIVPFGAEIVNSYPTNKGITILYISESDQMVEQKQIVEGEDE